MFPYFVTGALTASGGSWNASIVAEVVVWGHERLEAPGLGAWIAAGGPLEIGTVQPAPGDVTARDRHLYDGELPTLTAHDAPTIGTLVDARAPERFRGEVEPVDPVAGHIPGAKSLPATGLLDDDGAFLSESDLRQLFTERGVQDTVGAYFGSGVTASPPPARAPPARGPPP